MRRVLLGLALLSACGGSSSSTKPATTTRPSSDLPGAPPVLLDRPVWDGPLTDPMALRALDRVRTALADQAPALQGADPRMWRGPVQGWVEKRVKLTREVRADADALASDPDPRMQLLAAIVYGVAANDFVNDLLSLEPPPEVTSGEFGTETKIVFREALESQAAPLAGSARAMLQKCAAAAPTAPAPLRVWEAYCREQDGELADLETRVAARGTPSNKPIGKPIPQKPAFFADCDTKEPLRISPTALPPDKKVKPSVAYLYDGSDIKDTAEIAKLEAAVAAKLGPATGMKVVTDKDLAAARKLVGQKKLHAKALTCGQAPPLTAVVAHKAKHLVLGEIATTCIYKGMKKESCGLSIRYLRAGDDDHTGLPGPMYAEVPARDVPANEWIAAVDKLAPHEGFGGLLGMLGGDDTKVFTAFSSAADEDPWLRVPWTLRETTADHLESCVDAGASFDATFTITRDGKTKGVTLAPLSPPPAGTKVAACVKRALEDTPWPCTRDGKPAKVSVRMCVAPRPQ